MRILIVHNQYQLRGGEDSVVDSEIDLLRQNGCFVDVYRRSNDEISAMSRLDLAAQTSWSARTVRDIQKIIGDFRPDVIHAHNTFPLISPSLYWAAVEKRVPVVQTLHNFRMMCLNALFLRDGKVCTDCSGAIPWRGVVRGCYRDSIVASAVMASMLMLHRTMGTFQKQVGVYIALNEFCRRRFVEGGLPVERVVVKPNFVHSGGVSQGPRSDMLFVGRLSNEKGIATLARALPLASRVRCLVAGDGPEAPVLQSVAGAQRLGSLTADLVRAHMGQAVALVVPSICFENFPRTIAEAFSAGLPVIASRIGALADIVVDGHNGLLFEAGNAEDLASKMTWANEHPLEMAEMGARARADYEAKYSPDVNFKQLMEIYNMALVNGVDAIN